VLEHLGTATFIAAALGLTIDYWLKKQITEDVFRAAMGYELPDELKQEIRFIYGNRILCEDHSQTVTIANLDNGFVTCTVGVERVLRNIGETDHRLELDVALDEWRVPNHPSHVLEFAYAREDGKRVEIHAGKDVETEQRAWGPKLKLKKHLSLGPKETITTFIKISETKPTESDHYFTFKYPALNPLVRVSAPEGYGWLVAFAHWGKHKKGRYSETVRLEGALLPHQSIRVRWWREAKAGDVSSTAESASPSA